MFSHKHSINLTVSQQFAAVNICGLQYVFFPRLLMLDIVVENYLEPVPRKDLCSPVNVNDKYALPADLDRIIPTKDNCVEHYTNIRRFLKQ